MITNKQRSESAFSAVLAHASYSLLDDSESTDTNTKIIELLKGLRVLCDEYGVDFEADSKLKSTKAVEAAIPATITDNPSNVYIDDVLIDASIFDNETVDWKLVELECVIDDLFSWIGEAKTPDKSMMIEDLKILLNWDDDFIWSNISTNAYISPSKNPERFNEVCINALTQQSLIAKK